MFDKLKKLLEGGVAQVNPFDGGKTFASVNRQAQSPGTPAQQQTARNIATATKFGPAAPQRPAITTPSISPGRAILDDLRNAVKSTYNMAPASVKQRVQTVGAVRDVFDANTIKDQQKRQAAGEAKMYYDQQMAKGNQRPNQNIGTAVVGNTARLINTAKAGAGGVYGLGKIGASSIFGSDADYRRTVAGVDKTMDRDYSTRGGLLGAGTFFNSRKEAGSGNVADQTKRFVGAGVGTATEILPWTRGGKAISAISAGAKTVPRAVIGNAVENAAYGAAGSAAQQQLTRGSIDTGQVLQDTAIGAGLGAAIPAGGALFNKLKGPGGKALSDQADNLLSKAKTQVDDIAKKRAAGVPESQLVADVARKDQAISAAATARAATKEGGYVQVKRKGNGQFNGSESIPEPTTVLGKIKQAIAPPPQVQELNTYMDDLNIRRDKMLADGLAPNHPAVLANDQAYADAVREAQKFKEGGYIGLPGSEGKVYRDPNVSIDPQRATFLKSRGYTEISDGRTTIPLDDIIKGVPGKAEVLSNLNPTGGVLVDYNPKARATMPLGDNITTLAKTSGKSPDELITIYRGAPGNQKKIVPGDFITTNKELAQSYTGDGNVLEAQVKIGDVLDDITEPLGEEYIYRPTGREATKEGGYVRVPKRKGAPEGQEVLDTLTNDHANYLEQIHKETGGISKITDGEGTVTGRVSSNDPFYRKVYAETGRPPTKAAYFAEAQRQLEAGTAPKEAVDLYQATKSMMKETKPKVAAKPVETGTSRFAKRAETSPELSPELQAKVEPPTYTRTNNKDQIAASEALVKKGYKKAATDVMERLQAKTGTINDQTVSDAISVVKKLDEKGGTANLQQATDIFEKVSEHLTKSGQTIQAASLLNNRTPQGLYYSAQRTFKKNGVEFTPAIQKELKGLIDNVKATDAGTYEGGLARFKVIEYVNKKLPSSRANKVVQFWKAGLLTSPVTTAGNVTANTAEQIYKRGYVDPLTTAVDAIFSVFTGKRSKSLTGRGVFSGAKEGAIKGVSYFKTGYDPRNPSQKFDVRNVHYSDTKAGRAAESYTQGVFKLMGSQDQPFYYASLRNSLYDQAITEAKNKGLKSKAKIDYIKKFVTEPTKDALQLADKEARYDVFQNETALGKAASKVKNGSALGDFIIPFSGVPSSIATRIVERTPIGIAKEIVTQMKGGKFNQREMSRAIANGTSGIALIGAGKALYDAGNVTTSFPQDAKERRLWELEGKQPYSVKVGDKWISMNYFQPAGTLFAAGAEYSKAKKEGKDEVSAWAAATASAGKALTEQSFLKGVSGALNAVTDPQRAGERFAESTAGSVTPNFIRAFARSTDSVQRQINNPLDSFKGSLPGLRSTLTSKKDAFGEELSRPAGALSSYTNPLRPSDVKEGDMTTAELRRLQDVDQGIMTPEITKTALGADTKLTDAQIDELNVKIKPEIKEAWDGIIGDSRYAGLSDEDKMKVLRKAKEDIYSARKKEYQTDNAIGAAGPDGDSKKLKLTAAERTILGGGKSSAFTASGENKNNSDKYNEALDKWNDPDNGYSAVDKIKAQKELNKLKVAKDYDNDTTELHGLAKKDVYAFLSSSDQGKAMAEKLLAYDDALTAAGVQEKNKFRDKFGNATIKPKAKGGGGGGKKGTAALTAGRSTERKLRALLANTNNKTSYKSPGIKPALRKNLKKAKVA